MIDCWRFLLVTILTFALRQNTVDRKIRWLLSGTVLWHLAYGGNLFSRPAWPRCTTPHVRQSLFNPADKLTKNGARVHADSNRSRWDDESDWRRRKHRLTKHQIDVNRRYGPSANRRCAKCWSGVVAVCLLSHVTTFIGLHRSDHKTKRQTIEVGTTYDNWSEYRAREENVCWTKLVEAWSATVNGTKITQRWNIKMN